jgi:hypothetical protein
MNDTALFDEAVTTQLFTSQYALKSLGEFELALSNMANIPFNKIDPNVIPSLYEDFANNLMFDTQLIEDYVFYKLYKTLLHTEPPKTPEESRTNIHVNISLQTNKGAPLLLNPAKKIAKLKKAHKLALQTTLQAESIESINLLNQMYTIQMKAIANTFISEAVNTTRAFLFTTTEQKGVWLYLSILDSKTTHYCASMAFTVSEDITFWPLTPPAHYHCRSWLLKVSSKKQANKLTKDATIADWLKQKPESFQKDFLGKKAFINFQNGKLTTKQTIKALTRRFRTAEELLAKKD